MATDGQPADGGGQLAPLSDAQLAEFRECARLYDETNIYGKMNYGDVGFRLARYIIPALLAERERLLAVARAVADCEVLWGNIESPFGPTARMYVLAVWSDPDMAVQRIQEQARAALADAEAE